jgi:hypothetical protein
LTTLSSNSDANSPRTLKEGNIDIDVEHNDKRRNIISRGQPRAQENCSETTKEVEKIFERAKEIIFSENRIVSEEAGKEILGALNSIDKKCSMPKPSSPHK